MQIKFINPSHFVVSVGEIQPRNFNLTSIMKMCACAWAIVVAATNNFIGLNEIKNEEIKRDLWHFTRLLRAPNIIRMRMQWVFGLCRRYFISFSPPPHHLLSRPPLSPEQILFNIISVYQKPFSLSPFLCALRKLYPPSSPVNAKLLPFDYK